MTICKKLYYNVSKLNHIFKKFNGDNNFNIWYSEKKVQFTI